MEWCIRGTAVPDEDGEKKATLHMDDDPKAYLAANVRSFEELSMLANNV